MNEFLNLLLPWWWGAHQLDHRQFYFRHYFIRYRIRNLVLGENLLSVQIN